MKELLTQLLNLKCRDTNLVIQSGETVALHNWGFKSRDEVIAYGKFEFDEHERQFNLEINVKMSNILIDDFRNFDIDRYDLFRTSPRKLLESEKQYI